MVLRCLHVGKTITRYGVSKARVAGAYKCLDICRSKVMASGISIGVIEWVCGLIDLSMTIVKMR
jgi:hypothetical protein